MSRITQGLLADEKELKMAKKSWEGSAADTAQDKKLAKKHGMSMSDWEKSSMDTKHDKQQSTEGLRGGGIAVKGKGIALKKGGKVGKYAMGGMTAPAMPGGGMGTGGPDPFVGGGSFGSGRGNIGGGSIDSVGRSGLKPMQGDGVKPVRDYNPRGPGGGQPVGRGMDANARFARMVDKGRMGPEGNPPNPGMRLKKGGAVKEADSGEMYASKAAMKKHEAKESSKMEKAEHKMRGGGIAVKGKGIALRGGGIAVKGKGIALRGGGIAQRGMGIAMKGGGRAKGCK